MIGDLRCKNCHFDYDSCSLCGNNQIDTGEDCDGDKMGASASCLTVDDGAYIGGTLKCNVDACTFDTRDCVKPTCGDGVAQGLEECDEDDLRKERCGTFVLTYMHIIFYFYAIDSL